MKNNYFDELEALRLAYPDLTLNNKGYEEIPKDVREANKEGNTKIEELLETLIASFIKFQNFKQRDDGTFAIRCQTAWTPYFVGVSYFPMEDFKPDSPLMAERSQMIKIEEIKAQIKELEDEDEAATSWGAAAGARWERIQSLKRALRYYTKIETVSDDI